MDWPRGPTNWIEGRKMRVSIPFTWNLPAVRDMLLQRSFLWDSAEVGGPAVELMPDFFSGMDWVEIGRDCPGILQRINPDATRTTTGCVRRCVFCGIGTGKIEAGGLRELEDWHNGTVICDNNLLAASEQHIEKVMGRLIRLGKADFNQGLDARILNSDHAEYIAAIDEPVVRLAMDHQGMRDEWEQALATLTEAGVSKKSIRSYCIIGFQTPPEEAWKRCEWVEKHGVLALPMWFHSLDSLTFNTVTKEQCEWGWTEDDRLHIMGYYYQHRGQVPQLQA